MKRGRLQLAVAIGLLVLTGLVWATAFAQEKLPKKGAPGVEELPPPRPAEPGGVAMPPPGGWIGPDGAHWMFDGLRWKVLWENGKWYPAIPPGPLPCWKTADFGMGWKGVLPPNSSIWHVVPPSFALMPPPAALPPMPPPPHHRVGYSGYRGWRGHR